jgi:hypothetical protein
MKKELILFITILLFGQINLSFAQTVIQMEHIDGVDYVPCKVNGLDLKFIFDSGASDVSISLIEGAFMLKNGYLAESDILEKTYSTTATGEISAGTKINIRTIIIGSITLHNIEAQVRDDIQGDLLFGQTAMAKLGTFQINPITHTLTIINAPKNTIAPKTITPSNISNNYIPNDSVYPTNNKNLQIPNYETHYPNYETHFNTITANTSVPNLIRIFQLSLKEIRTELSDLGYKDYNSDDSDIGMIKEEDEGKWSTTVDINVHRVLVSYFTYDKSLYNKSFIDDLIDAIKPYCIGDVTYETLLCTGYEFDYADKYYEIIIRRNETDEEILLKPLN